MVLKHLGEGWLWVNGLACRPMLAIQPPVSG